MWESYKEQEEFGKDVLKQLQNHLSKIPLPVPDDALASAVASRTGAAANSRWGSNGYSANSKEFNGDELPDLLQQSRSDAIAPKKRSRVDRPSNNGTGLSSLETDCLELEPLPSEKEMMRSNSCTEISNEFDLSKRETIQETRELQDLGAEYLEQLLMSSSCCEPEIEMSDINLFCAIKNPHIANYHVDNSEFFPDLLLPNLVVLSKLLLHIDRVVCTPHDFFDATGSIFPPELGN
jgi:hypothetical protein